MRLTDKLIANSITNNFFAKTEQMFKAQQRISTGKDINRPSDDPIGMSQVLDYRKTIASIEQYNKNISLGKSQLKITDSTLAAVDNILIRAKEVAVYQASGTASPEERAIVTEEVKSIRDQLLHLANTKLGNSYIFSGHKTDTAPFPEEGNPDFEYQGDLGETKIIVGEQVHVSINVTGEAVFAGSVNIFNVLKELERGLAENQTDVISEQIVQLTESLDQVLKTRAEVGKKLNMLETSESYWGTFKLNTEEMLYRTEDADITEAVSSLTMLETAYEASLAASAKIIQPSIIDFLR